MKNKILKYKEYITESKDFESSETYISSVLNILKRKIEKIFNQSSDNIDNIETLDRKSKVKNGELSLLDLGIKLESCEISKYSKIYDNLKVIFIDDKNRYDMIISIDLKYVEDLRRNNEDFDIDNIEECICKFKKYDISNNVELVGTLNKKLEISKINEDELISLKIEMDEKFGDDDQDEFKIEYEEN